MQFFMELPSNEVTSKSSSLTKNLSANRVELTNSTYYPTSFLYKSGQLVYLRCSGLTTKEITADSELTVAVESDLPEDYRPVSNIIGYVNISQSKIIRIAISDTGKITFRSPEDLVVGFGVNLHFVYATGKAIL